MSVLERLLFAIVGVALFAAMLALAPPAKADSMPKQENVEAILNQSAEQLRDRIEAKHPVFFFALAKRLFEQGSRNEAVFWFHLGQLRYRSYLKLNPKLDPSGEPALFGGLIETIGQPIDEYAFGDVAALVATIDRAITWDAAHPDPFAPQGPERDEVVNGLKRLKVDIITRADEIRATRAKKGLENRTN